MNYVPNDTEAARCNKFAKKHSKKCNSGISYTFTPTGIGMNITVQCLSCKKTKDITDYDCW